jgi:formiminoglutamase
MEGAQSRLANVVADAIRAGHRPLVLGGGHETAWGTFQGIVAAKPEVEIGVINIDAHLDLRADEPGNSGTPFNQMAKWCAGHGRRFNYLCVGAAWQSNTSALFRRIGELGAGVIHDDAFFTREPVPIGDILDGFIRRSDQVYLSIDLDVLPAAVMPAVSAPAARGIPLEGVETVLHRILVSDRVVAVEIVELNPTYDTDNHGARVAARLVYQTAKIWE